MNKNKKFISHIPGWLIWLLVLGSLYLSGLHTEVIGGLQRLVLATGFIRPDIEADNKIAAEGGNSYPVADYGFSLKNLDGDIMDMESLKGKVVFMNFWATWCPPCIAEMPNIQSLYEKVKSDKIAFVMVSLDQDPAKAQKFISRKGFTFPVYTPNGPIPAVYEGQAIPSTFIISPEGYIVARKDGMANYDNLEFRQFLEQLVTTGEGNKPN